MSLGKSPGPLAGYTPLQHPSLSTAQTAMQQPQQLYLDPVSIMQPVPHQRQQQHMMMQSQTPQAQQQHGVFGIPHQHVAPRVASTEEIEVQVPRQAYNRQASVQAYHSMAPAPGTLPSPTMLGGQQQQPQPGRPPLVPWTGADASAGVLPPPPPPQRVRSQSPVARQSPPARQLLPPAGTHKVHSGGFGSGFGAVNRDHQGHSQAHQHQHHGHRHFRSKYMSDEDIRHILRIQWAAVHSGNPYHEDYYYQAFLAKHVNGANAAAFAPDTLRVTAPQERAGQDATTWVPVEGLGKIAMSNIRRPKPLMELAPDQRTDPKEEEVNESLERMAPTRPLEQEPLLAARIMVEDCMSLLLDVDDIERMFRRSMVTGLQVEDAESLMHRRTVLMEGLAASLRLPGVQFTSSGASELNDGVFLRLMTLPKGRRLLGQALRRLFSAFEPASANSVLSSPQLRILNAVMRNLRMLFGFLPPEDSVVAQAKVSKEAAAGIARQSRAAAMETTATIAAAGARDNMSALCTLPFSCVTSHTRCFVLHD